MQVKIRFNTNYPKRSDKKWRVIVEGFEHLTDDVQVLCESYTSEDTVIDDNGKKVQKFHISCNPVDIEITPEKVILYPYPNPKNTGLQFIDNNRYPYEKIKCDFCGKENIGIVDKYSVVVYCNIHERLKEEANREYTKLAEEYGGYVNISYEKNKAFMEKYSPFKLLSLNSNKQ